MSFLSGSNGFMRYGKQGIVKPRENDGLGTGWKDDENTRISSWTLSTSSSLLDTTTLGAYDKSSVYGLRTTTGTLRLFYYTNDPAQSGRVDNNTASWFFNAMVRARFPQAADSEMPPNPDSITSIPVWLRLFVDSRNSVSLDDFIEFRANLNNVSIASNVGELVVLNATFEANGQIYQNRI